MNLGSHIKNVMLIFFKMSKLKGRKMKNSVLLLVISSLAISCTQLGKRSVDDGINETDIPLQEVPDDQKRKNQSFFQRLRSEDVQFEGDALGGEIPHEINSAVLKWVDYFQGRGRRHMVRYLGRSSRYLPMMKKILREEGLPEDLVYIALIESGFQSHARSHASAVGYWQFIRSTGRSYGLKVNSVVDERRDYVLATRAAARYLKSLHYLFNDWYLAIASYNVGENRIKSLVMRHHTRNFWDLARERRLPSETINYVPKYLAARMIAKNPEKYGFNDVAWKPALEFDVLKVHKAVNIRKLASYMSIPVKEIKKYNPAFRTDYAPVSKNGVLELKIPKGRLLEAQTVVARAEVKSASRIARMMNADTFKYRIRSGDTLSGIATKHRVRVSDLRRANNLSRRSVIRAGRYLDIPYYGKRTASNNSNNDSKKVHRVRRGETLSHISRRYRVSIRKIAQANDLNSRSRIRAGSELIIPN